MSRLDEIRKRTEAATEGPWKNDGWDNFNPDTLEACCVVEFPKDIVAVFVNADGCDTWEEARSTNAANDADFIAHSREDIPYLLGLVDRLKTAAINMRDCFGVECGQAADELNDILAEMEGSDE